MLTRSVFVRKLVPANPEEFQANPAGYQGEWNTNPTGAIGEIVSETFMPIPDPANPGNMKMLPVVGVCWDDVKVPAIAYEDLAFLENVDDLVDAIEAANEEEEFLALDEDGEYEETTTPEATV